MWYLIYLLLASCCFFSIWKLKNNKIIYFIFFIITILFVGLRENVGIDYKVDLIIFNSLTKVKGYFIYILSFILKKYHFNFPMFTFVFGVLNTFLVQCITKSNFKRKKSRIESWYIYILDYGYISSFNVMRQGIANLIFLIAIKKNSYIKFVFFLIIGYGFHKSILLLIPIFFIIRKKFNIKIIKILCISIIFLSLFFDFQSYFIKNIFPYLGYYSEIYARKELVHFVVEEMSFGLGRMVRVVLCLSLIFFYDDLAKKGNSNYIYLNLSILWGILTLLTYKIFIISRVLEYFYLSTIITYPLMLDELKKRKLGKYLIITFWIILILFYLKATIFSDASQKLIPYNNILF